MRRSRFRVDKKGRMFVGTYTLTSHRVDVYLDDSDCASFWWPLTSGSDYSRSAMTVGADCEWHRVVKRIVHEAFEASTMMHQCLFERSTFLSNDSCGRHILQMDHAQFTEIADEVGDMLTYLLPDAAAAFREWEKIGGKR